MADLVFNDRFMITDAGGFAVRLINKTGVNSVKGTLVRASTTPGGFSASVADGRQAFGAVYQAGVADGSLAWVTVSGVAEVLLEDGTASTAGNWCRGSAAVAGRATMNAADPSSTTVHEREIGHCIETKAQGVSVIAKCIMHFN
jgi:hypothetical protein